MTLRVEDIEANGLTFNCRRDGPDDGDLVVLLHGFPETSRMWLPLIERLASGDYQVLAPNQRGYSPGARPAEEAAYAYANLVEDLFSLVDAVGGDRFHLVAHDHGAGVGWAASATRPERLASYIAMSGAARYGLQPGDRRGRGSAAAQPVHQLLPAARRRRRTGAVGQ